MPTQNNLNPREFKWILLTGLAVIASVIKIPLGFAGGSVALDLLILFLILFNFDFKHFATSLLIYLILSTLLGGTYYFSFLQWSLDYIIALISLGVGAVFINSKSGKLSHELAIITIGLTLKTVVHIISGALFFAQNAPIGQNVIVYSFIYNLTYMLPTLVLTIFIYLILKKAKITTFE